MIAYEQLVV